VGKVYPEVEPRTATWVTNGPVYLVAKRAMDVVLVLIGLLLLSPLLLLVALAIKLYDRGPVFFSQVRVGKGGREFKFWKFRSMCVDAEAKKAKLVEESDPELVRFKMERDPRITPIGRFIRRTSIDELPQLWNVLVGDMAIVGPRPPVPSEVARYTRHQHKRLDLEQGLTCVWQVEGRSLIPFEQQVEMDLQYGRDRNLLLDISLIARTIPAVLSGRGAF
jgi:lipopolysaccharide/colanic/teichoic acid biosynthesis glycosyltransferase